MGSERKGLVAVPQTLAMMSEKLDWLQQLGDAFLDDRARCSMRSSVCASARKAQAI